MQFNLYIIFRKEIVLFLYLKLFYLEYFLPIDLWPEAQQCSADVWQ